MRTVAIMQPYFLPYIGYFQLMAAVERFVVFDDVNYINRGWINRNRLLLNGQAHTFTVPLRGASQNKLICDIELADDDDWRDKLLRTVRQAYVKAPCYADVSVLMERIIRHPVRRLDEFLLNSLREIAGYLELPTEIVGSSRTYGNAQLRGQERILDICRQEGAQRYINAIGGEALYERARFNEQGVELKFLRSRPLSYAQGGSEFVPWLSILDVLMFNPRPEARRLLGEMDLT
ncbi:MAG TPA: WbqC family protein [Gallionella sp.]|nr:WbqC family protein [Gallionella sp.]